MNEGGEIMTTTVIPEVGLTPVQEAQPDLAVSPARSVDTAETSGTNEKPEEVSEEVDKIRESLEASSNETPEMAVEENADAENGESEQTTNATAKKDGNRTRLVINWKALLKRTLALTFQIIIKAITEPEKTTYTKNDVRIGDDPASQEQNNLDKLMGHDDTSWNTVRKDINNLNGEFSLNDFLSTVLGINEKVVPYMIEKDTDTRKGGKGKAAKIFNTMRRAKRV